MSRRIIVVAFVFTVAAATVTLGQARADAQAAPESKPDPSKPSKTEDAALRMTLKSLAKALQEGNGERIRQVLHAENPTERKMIDAMASMAGEIAQLYKTSVKAFGEEQAKDLTGDTSAEMTRIDEAQISIEGDTAKVRYAQPATDETDEPAPPAAVPMVLKKVDGKWKVPIAELSKDTTPEEIEQRLLDLEAQTKVIRELTAEITEGKYKSVEEAAEAWQTKMMQALMPPRKPSDEKQASSEEK